MGRRSQICFFNRLLGDASALTVEQWLSSTNAEVKRNRVRAIGLSSSTAAKVSFKTAAGSVSGYQIKNTRTGVLKVVSASARSVTFKCPSGKGTSIFTVRAYGKARRWIQGALGALFAFAGVRLLLSRS
jgi:hypothetical protein